MQLPVISKRAISADELCPYLDTGTRKAESMRCWFGLRSLSYLWPFNAESGINNINPDDTINTAVPSETKISIGEDASPRYLDKENLLQHENPFVVTSEDHDDKKKDDGDDAIQCDFLQDKKSACVSISNLDYEKKDDDSATLINPRRWRRVLIVDDVPMNCKMLRRLFSNRFEECKEAENGKVAVDMVTEAMASGVSFDVITMDYQMPVMDGVTATRCIRKLGYKGLIVAVTGNALSEDVNAFLSNGADIVLTKPLSIERLYKYLNTAI